MKVSTYQQVLEGVCEVAREVTPIALTIRITSKRKTIISNKREQLENKLNNKIDRSISQFNDRRLRR